jgi:deferrochelatase/peroxidase EfeB
MQASRRRFLAAAAAAGAGLSGTAHALAADAAPNVPPATVLPATVRFWGAFQSGIVTPSQTHTYFAAFDLLAATRAEVAALLRTWTAAAARLTMGLTVGQPATPLADTGEAYGLGPARLTLTFGFGAGLFEKDGADRYGLRAQRPEAFVDLPRFAGDALVPERTGGDISVQACADDPQVAFHAVRQLARLGEAAARLRWAQSGFLPHPADGETPRNLMGFKDGTRNPPTSVPASMHRFVWVGGEAPVWMQGGSYVVARRIRIALERWDRMSLAFQEQAVGRQKLSGAPLGGQREFDPIDLDATDHDGTPLLPENSHVRLAHPESNDHAQILRRPYSFNDGISIGAAGAAEYDAGLLFVCYQRDPRTGFIKIYQHMAPSDRLNQFATHVGGGLFACPRGVQEGDYIGQPLFEGA